MSAGSVPDSLGPAAPPLACSNASDARPRGRKPVMFVSESERLLSCGSRLNAFGSEPPSLLLRERSSFSSRVSRERPSGMVPARPALLRLRLVTEPLAWSHWTHFQ